MQCMAKSIQTVADLFLRLARLREFRAKHLEVGGSEGSDEKDSVDKMAHARARGKGSERVSKHHNVRL